MLVQTAPNKNSPEVLIRFFLEFQGVAHVALPLFLNSVRVALLEPNLISGAHCAVGLFLYLVHWVVGKELIELTPQRMKSFCYSIHICCLVFMRLGDMNSGQTRAELMESC